MRLIKPLFLFASLIFFFASCEKEDPIIPNEEEVITTLTYVLSTQDPNDTVILSFTDLDGDGGNEPVVTSGTLKANTSYTGVLELLNEQEDPAENITVEVEEESVDHQFFFESTIPGITIAYADQDSDGNPLGIITSLETADAGTGTIKITLLHKPIKDAEQVSEGIITNAGGESDIEVAFDIDVE